MRNTTELISWAQPTNERLLVDHIFTLPMILSTRVMHSSLLSRLAVIGMPRYLIGRSPYWKPVMRVQADWNSTRHPPNTSCDLVWLALSPEQLWNSFKLCIIIFNVRGWALQKIRTSSVNIRWFSFRPLQLGWKRIVGENSPWSSSLKNTPWSRQKKKKRGESVSLFEAPSSLECPTLLAIYMNGKR